MSLGMLPAAALAQAVYCPDQRQILEGSHPGYPVTREELERVLADMRGRCARTAEAHPTNPSPRMTLAWVAAFSGDAEAAAREARAAAELGSQEAPALLGALQARGEGMPKDPAAAVEILRKAARNAPLAAYNLGVMYANGDGIARDEGEAFRYFHGAASGRDALAMIRVGLAYASGRGVTRDPAQAEAWWRKAADSLAIEAHPHPGRLREREAPDAAPFVDWLRARAGAGEPWAQTCLGSLYERGVFVKRDFDTALVWYRRGAAGQFTKAEARIGEMYAYGRGVALDRAEARRWSYKWMERQCEEAVQAQAGANDCDRLAGDPYDPRKVTAGSQSRCLPMHAERAVAACRKASSASPGTVRFRAQLARALLHSRNFGEGRREAEAAARGGSTTAMVLLAAVHENGYGVEKDQAKALAWYRKAADANDARAVQHALRLYEAREGTDGAGAREMRNRMPGFGPRSSQLPVNLQPTLLARAERGDPGAQHNYAAMIEKQNPGEAIEWYRKAAAQGYALSQYNLAQMHEQGMGMPRDTAQAVAMYRKLAETGFGEARMRVSMLEIERGNYAEAHKWLPKLAADNDTRAMIELGLLYEHGKGVAKDLDQAIKWYERAAPHSPWAEFKLGAVHSQRRDHAEAAKWWRKSADRGNPHALYNLAYMQEHGLGMPKDEAAAFEIYLKAAERGSPHARNNLEIVFDEDRGAPGDAEARIEWLKRGAELGLPTARYRLGELYERPGRTQNYAEAMRWYGLAEGDPRALRSMARLYERNLGVPRGDEDPRKRQLIVQLLLAQAEKQPARKLQALGLALDPGEDPMRKMQVRVAAVGEAHAAAMDMGWYVVISLPPEKK